jgi:hypothetical protein
MRASITTKECGMIRHSDAIHMVSPCALAGVT